MDMAAVVVIVAGLRAASSLVTQLLLVAFFVIVLSPFYYWLKRRRLASWLALLVVISALVVGVMVSVVLLAQSFKQLAATIPGYYVVLRRVLADFTQGMAQWGVYIPENFLDEYVNWQNTRTLATNFGFAAQRLFARGFFIMLITAFCLCELPKFPKLRQSRWMTESLWERCVHVTDDVRHYMGIKTLISFGTAALTYVGLVLFGIDSPFLLAVMVFILNYVPVVGSVVSAIPGIMLALVQYGVWYAVAVAGMYIGINALGIVAEPQLMGRGFGISPVLVLISMLFWGFVLGPVGMMLSVPLTMGVKVVWKSLQEMEEK